MKIAYAGAAILAASCFIALAGLSPAAAKPAYIRDQCNQTSGDGMGHDCAGEDDLLIRPKYPDGTCGDWMCCPPNGDGSYDCTKATNPTLTAIDDKLKVILGDRAQFVLEPTKPPPAPPKRRKSESARQTDSERTTDRR